MIRLKVESLSYGHRDLAPGVAVLVVVTLLEMERACVGPTDLVGDDPVTLHTDEVEVDVQVRAVNVRGSLDYLFFLNVEGTVVGVPRQQAAVAFTAGSTTPWVASGSYYYLPATSGGLLPATTMEVAKPASRRPQRPPLPVKRPRAIALTGDLPGPGSPKKTAGKRSK